MQSTEQPQHSADEKTSIPELHVVGIGGSAGGLAAVQQFLAHMPNDSGMAFVVILHLSPEYESNLAAVLQQTTAMPVSQVTERVLVERDHVYVIPPAKGLAMADGHIELSDPVKPRGQRAPIDLFFRTLAESHQRNAVAIVLSGTGADGSIGAPRIKEDGGIVLVQDPAEAEYDAMPRNAMATGLVDLVLPVAAMPNRLLAYWRNVGDIHLPNVEALRAIFALMRARTGHDFSQYKLSTIMRRIGRRMQVQSVVTLAAYTAALRSDPNEVQALLRDLLISVTNFFRDPDAWQAVAQIIPRLFAEKRSDEAVRVWVTGCATGEEAYTLAMLLREYAETLDHPPAIQIFATDIDEDAIAYARQGLYLSTIVNDITPERLQHFFTPEQGRYRIRREIRDTVLFAVHNVLHDPPFSRLDLITCRNVLIYLNRTVQEQVLQLFHFTLRNDGYLLLGTSESTDSVAGMFTTIHKAQCLFQRRAVPSIAPLAVPSLPMTGALRERSGKPRSVEAALPSFGDLDLYVLTNLGPPTIIVNEEYEIVYLARGAGQFLTLVDGEPSHNLLKVAHPALRLELRTALLAVIKQQDIAETRNILAEIDREQRAIQIAVQPLQSPEWARGYVAVIFRDVAPSATTVLAATSDVEPLIHQLDNELQRTKDQLRATVEQYETAVEEYKAGNEELQAINKELRAATEELETGKEELQSVNEELITVNQELKHKIEELSLSNNDLQNLMASTEIGTIFVDFELRIKRYTPSAQTIFNLIPGDINRPLAHITHQLTYSHLVADAQRVLDTLARTEREVQSANGQWYLARLQPYRTSDNQIDGVVITFVDITERVHAEASLRESEEHVRAIIEQTFSGIAETDLAGRFTLVNDRYCEMLGYTSEQLLGGMLMQDVTHPEDLPRNLELFERMISQGVPFAIEKRYIRKDGSFIWVHNNVSAIRDASGKPRAAVAIWVDITERQQSEAALRESEERLRLVIDSVQDYAIFTIDPDGRFDSWNIGAELIFGYREAEMLGQNWTIIFTPEDRIAGMPLSEIQRALAGGTTDEERWYVRKDGSSFYASGVLSAVAASGQVRWFVKVLRDLTNRKQAEQALEERVIERTIALTKINVALQAEVEQRRVAEQGRQDMLRQLVTAQEEERQRIARELHDQLGQQFTALRLGLAALQDKTTGTHAQREKVARLQQLATTIDEDVDRLALELRPSVLDDLGLLDALQQHVDEWAARTGVEAELQSSAATPARFLPEAEIVLYRVVQEALNNIAKHANARHVSVILEQREDQVQVIVEDDGAGFDPESVPQTPDAHRKLGVVGMQERVALIGGTVTIESSVGSGATIYFRVPLK